MGGRRTGERGAIVVLHRAGRPSDHEACLSRESNCDVIPARLVLAQRDDDSPASNIDARAHRGVDSVRPGEYERVAVKRA
jgi:hypothetical protein